MQLKNFTDLPKKIQGELFDKFFDDELTFRQIEEEYEVNPESFKKYLESNIEDIYRKEYPKSETNKMSWVEKFAMFFDTPFRRFLGSLGVSMMLIYSFIYCSKHLAKIGIDPFTNILVTCAIGSGGIFLIILTVKKNIIFFTDIENFRYFLKGGNYPRDYSYDLQNGLTTYERCNLNQTKYLFYLACYVAVYIATVLTFRMIAYEA